MPEDHAIAQDAFSTEPEISNAYGLAITPPVIGIGTPVVAG
jgi:hypothetical protein